MKSANFRSVKESNIHIYIRLTCNPV